MSYPLSFVWLIAFDDKSFQCVLNTESPAYCTDSTINTVGKCDTISVSIETFTMVSEGKKTLFIVPAKVMLK